MNTRTFSNANIQVVALYRPAMLIVAGIGLLCIFWFASRYPSLLSKASHVGQAVPSMGFSRELITLPNSAPVWQTIAVTALNWIDGMKIGMGFGVLFGALLHTALRHYPLRIGRNVYLNAFKGAVIGVPMGVCANCSVPAACGVTRGNGRVEVALGFLFSSPNFNPVVIVMTFVALPWTMGVAKYAILLTLILLVVPSLIVWLERKTPLTTSAAGVCEIETPSLPPQESFAAIARSLTGEYFRHVWMLAKPTIVLLAVASLLAAAMLTLVPWQTLLAEVTPLKALLLSILATAMPVPIALDVMFAAQLRQQGAPAGYVMLFAMTLGTYSLVPTVYLWREVSRRLAVALFGFFVAVGWVVAMVF